jgi:hypothetical protein
MRRYDGGNPTHLDLQPIEVSSVPIGGVGLTSDFSYPMFSTKEQDWALMGEREHIPSYMRRLHRDGMDEGQRRRLCRDSAAIANRFAARDLSVQPALPEKADCLDNPELAAAQEDGLDEKQVARVVKDLNKDEALSAMKFAREATLERTVASGASKITIDDRDDLDAAVATHSQKVMAEFGLQDSGEEDLDLEDACDAD